MPNLVKLDSRYYLIGSIREGVKVHYWYADALEWPPFLSAHRDGPIAVMHKA